jgi:hypothetical protein
MGARQLLMLLWCRRESTDCMGISCKTHIDTYYPNCMLKYRWDCPRNLIIRLTATHTSSMYPQSHTRVLGCSYGTQTWAGALHETTTGGATTALWAHLLAMLYCYMWVTMPISPSSHTLSQRSCAFFLYALFSQAICSPSFMTNKASKLIVIVLYLTCCEHHARLLFLGKQYNTYFVTLLFFPVATHGHLPSIR